MMCWSSADVQLLLTSSERTEVERALQVKYAALVTDILLSLKKKKSSIQKFVCDTASGQEAAGILSVYCSHANCADFVPQTLFPSLHIAHCLLTCKQVGVTCLRDAVHAIGEYSGNEDRTVCVIGEFFRRVWWRCDFPRGFQCVRSSRKRDTKRRTM